MKRLISIATVLAATLGLGVGADAAPPERGRFQGNNANASWYDEASDTGVFVDLSVPTSGGFPAFVFIDRSSCSGDNCTFSFGGAELTAGQYTIVANGSTFSASVDATVSLTDTECGPTGCDTGDPYEAVVTIHWAATSGRVSVSTTTYHNVGPSGFFGGSYRMLSRETTATGTIDGDALGSSDFAGVGRSAETLRFRVARY